MKLPAVLPPNILKCLSAADRKSLGKAGLTPEEVLAKMEIKNEGVLQRQIIGYLRLKGIEVVDCLFGKRTRHKPGTPDLMFAVCKKVWDGAEDYTFVTVAYAWELKMPETGKSSKEQEAMADRMQNCPNAWRYQIITSLDEAITELKSVHYTP